MMLHNFSWCEIWRISIPCKRKVTDMARTSTKPMPSNFWRIRHWIWFIWSRSSQSKPAPNKAHHPRAICIKATCATASTQQPMPPPSVLPLDPSKSRGWHKGLPDKPIITIPFSTIWDIIIAHQRQCSYLDITHIKKCHYNEEDL